MCLSVPRRVDQVRGNKALLQDGRWVLLTMVDKVKKGDLLLVNANLAIEKVSKRKVKLMKEVININND